LQLLYIWFTESELLCTLKIRFRNKNKYEYISASICRNSIWHLSIHVERSKKTLLLYAVYGSWKFNLLRCNVCRNGYCLEMSSFIVCFTKKQNTSTLLSEVVVSARRHCRKPDQLITFYSQQFSQNQYCLSENLAEYITSHHDRLTFTQYSFLDSWHVPI